MEQRLYTQDELEEIFRRRTRDTEDLIGKVAERAVQKIRPEFDKVNQRLDDLTEQVKKTNGQVVKHSELIEDTGIEDLSKEQRAGLAEIAVEHEQMKDGRARLDGLERRRSVKAQVITSIVSNVTGGVVAVIAVYGFLRLVGLIN